MAVAVSLFGVAACGGAELEEERPWTATWVDCAWSADAEVQQPAECAEVQVPLNHDDPAAGEFTLRVKRRPAVGTARAQLWLLAGGPGDAATEQMASLLGGIEVERTDIDIYAVDHRGTGGSGKLVCDSQDLKLCAEELSGTANNALPFITTTQSARDIQWLIQRLGQDKQVFIYGGSYGTYLAQRYLQVDAARPSGVILEGVATAERPIAHYDAAMNAKGKALLDRCGRDPACSSHFGSADPWGVAVETVQALEDGHCPELGMTGDDLRATLGSLDIITQFLPLIPPLIAQIHRCAPADVERVQHFMAVHAAVDAESQGSSAILGAHIAVSELAAMDADASELETARRSHVFSSGIELTMASIAGEWPSYVPDEHVGKWSSYQGPMLMLQGAIDPASPVENAQRVSEHYSAPHQTLVIFPDASHTVNGATPTRSGGDCAKQLYLSFLRNPQRTPDVGCMDELLPLNFEESELSSVFFDTAQLWP